MPNLRKKKEQNKRNYIETDQEVKRQPPVSADPKNKKRLPPVLVIMLVLRRKGQPPVPVIGLTLRRRGQLPV